MNPIIKDVIFYGIEKNYKFIYRNPCTVNPDDYIDLHLEAKNVFIDAIWDKVKDCIENKDTKTITLIMKG